jgi:GNAT superfamily N-acetyltransferase
MGHLNPFPRHRGRRRVPARPTFRRARRDDARDLALLHQAEGWCFDDENVIHEYWDDAFSKESILVAQVGKVVVGTLELAIAHKTRWGGPFGLIRRFTIHPEWRSRGIGRKLFDFAMREAKRLRLAAVELNVEGWNSSPYQFYRSKGFVEDRVEVVMVKRLRPARRPRRGAPEHL